MHLGRSKNRKPGNTRLSVFAWNCLESARAHQAGPLVDPGPAPQAKRRHQNSTDADSTKVRGAPRTR